MATAKHMMYHPLSLLALLLLGAALSQADAASESLTTGARRELKQAGPASNVNASTSASTDGDCAMPSTTYLFANSKNVIRGVYSPNFAPVAHVQSGDVITAECVTHQAPQDYAKMIRGDPGVEDIYNWPTGVAAINKSVPVYPGNGAHILTGPIRVCGAEPGDILKVEILALSPRLNPSTGRAFGANTQSNPLTVLNVTSRSGTPNPSTAIVYEITKDELGAWATPYYQFVSPNVTGPDGRLNGQGAIIPHATNIGVPPTGFTPSSSNDYTDPRTLPADAVTYPEGFQSQLANATAITYLNSSLAYRIPLRPHLGTLGVTPANASKFINGAPNGTIGTSSQAPSRFGGNVDQWRAGAGSTMYYAVEVSGANLVLGDCHAAEGDSELSGNAVEASLTGTFRLSVIKQADAPLPFQTLNFPLLETDTEIVIHGFAYPDYVNDLPIPSQIPLPQYGPDLNKAMKDAYVKTRNFLMDGFGVTESEAISIISTGVDFDITQIVDANWGVHAVIKKSIFSRKSVSAFGRRLMGDDNTGKSVVDIMAEWKNSRHPEL